jgi:hypothetical protein
MWYTLVRSYQTYLINSFKLFFSYNSSDIQHLKYFVSQHYLIILNHHLFLHHHHRHRRHQRVYLLALFRLQRRVQVQLLMVMMNHAIYGHSVSFYIQC